jgi:hypothetical protein
MEFMVRGRKVRAYFRQDPAPLRGVFRFDPESPGDSTAANPQEPGDDADPDCAAYLLEAG